MAAMVGLSSGSHHYGETLWAFGSPSFLPQAPGMFSLSEAVATDQVFSPKMLIRVELRKSIVLQGVIFTLD